MALQTQMVLLGGAITVSLDVDNKGSVTGIVVDNTGTLDVIVRLTGNGRSVLLEQRCGPGSIDLPLPRQARFTRATADYGIDVSEVPD